MRDFHILEKKIDALQNEFKKINELQDHLNDGRYDFWRKCSEAHEDYEDLKKSKHDL